MAIICKAIKTGRPGVKGVAHSQYHLSVVHPGVVSFRDMCEEISAKCTLTRVDIAAAIMALTELAAQCVRSGYIVRMGDLGSLRLTIRAKAKNSEEEVTADDVTDAYVTFTPGAELKFEPRTLKFKKQKTDWCR